MSPITHFLAGWVAFEGFQVKQRDKALVALAGIAPDLDGLGIVVDFATRTLGLPETNYYQEYHRLYGHGLAAAIVISAVAAAMAQARWRVAVFAFLSVHLHFLCDVVGSRGTTPEDIWPIYYLAPFSTTYEIAWLGQWPLVGWQNMLITAVLLLLTLERATRTGYSPAGLVSKRGDGVLIETLRNWRRRLTRSGR